MNIPVLVGTVPLLAVTNFVLEEGYKVAPIAGSAFKQLVAPNAKTIKISALLVGGQRALRPALEAMALTSKLLASATGPLLKFTGIPVVAKNGVHLDMQVSSLTFTQDNVQRDTLKLEMTLVNVPRAKLSGLIGAGLDVVVGVGTAFI